MEIKSDIFEHFNYDRLLVFLEVSPQSNKYQQVLFTPEEFNRVSQSIGTVVATEGKKQDVELQLSNQIYDLPDVMEHYWVIHTSQICIAWQGGTY